MTDQSESRDSRLDAQAREAYEHWPLRMSGTSPLDYDGEYANRVAEERSTFTAGYVHGRADEAFRTFSGAPLIEARKRLIEDIFDLTDITRDRAAQWVLAFEQAVRVEAIAEAQARSEALVDERCAQCGAPDVDECEAVQAWMRSRGLIAYNPHSFNPEPTEPRESSVEVGERSRARDRG